MRCAHEFTLPTTHALNASGCQGWWEFESEEGKEEELASMSQNERRKRRTNISPTNLVGKVRLSLNSCVCVGVCMYMCILEYKSVWEREAGS